MMSRGRRRALGVDGWLKRAVSYLKTSSQKNTYSVSKDAFSLSSINMPFVCKLCISHFYMNMSFIINTMVVLAKTAIF